MIDMLRAAGMPADHPMIDMLRNGLRGADQLGAAGRVYGVDSMGNSMGKFTGPDGRSIVSGLLKNQAGEFTFPDFRAVRSLVADTKGGVWGALSKADIWMAEHYTNTVFKPLALLTPAFGMRISLAELVPATQDLGYKGIASNLLYSTGRKLAADKYLDPLSAFRENVAERVPGTIARMSSKKLNIATQARASILSNFDTMPRDMSTVISDVTRPGQGFSVMDPATGQLGRDLSAENYHVVDAFPSRDAAVPLDKLDNKTLSDYVY